MNVVRFYRAIYRDNRVRTQGRRRLLRDLGLYARNRALQVVERPLAARYRNPEAGLGFIVGVPRSGTTLLYQLAARFLEVAWIDNRMARYWMAPTYGALRHSPQRRERPEVALSSDFGVTGDPAGPHEFSWFWQFHMDFDGTDVLPEHALAAVDWAAIDAELRAVAGVFGRPLLLKPLTYVDYQVPAFHQGLPGARFLHVRRRPVHVVASILRARERRYGRRDRWWSIRPADVDAWRNEPPLAQVCHQVTDCLTAVERGLAEVPDTAQLTVDYEALVRSPRDVLARVGALLDAPLRPGAAVELEHLALRDGNAAQALPPEEVRAIEAALEEAA